MKKITCIILFISLIFFTYQGHKIEVANASTEMLYTKNVNLSVYDSGKYASYQCTQYQSNRIVQYYMTNIDKNNGFSGVFGEYNDYNNNKVQWKDALVKLYQTTNLGASTELEKATLIDKTGGLFTIIGRPVHSNNSVEDFGSYIFTFKNKYDETDFLKIKFERNGLNTKMSGAYRNDNYITLVETLGARFMYDEYNCVPLMLSFDPIKKEISYDGSLVKLNLSNFFPAFKNIPFYSVDLSFAEISENKTAQFCIYEINGQIVNDYDIKEKDTSVPKICLGKLSNKYYTLEEFLMPEIYAFDMQDGAKNFQMSFKDPDNEDVVLTDNKFIPQKAGEYTLFIQVADLSGKNQEKEIKIKIEQGNDYNSFYNSYTIPEKVFIEISKSQSNLPLIEISEQHFQMIKLYEKNDTELINPIASNILAYKFETIGEYIIEYTLVPFGNLEKSISHTTVLQIIDTTKPIITEKIFKNYKVGDELTDYATTATDNYDLNLTVITKIFFNNEELALNDGKYIFTKSGNYLVEYYCIDSNGNDNKITTTILVEENSEDNNTKKTTSCKRSCNSSCNNSSKKSLEQSVISSILIIMSLSVLLKRRK